MTCDSQAMETILSVLEGSDTDFNTAIDALRHVRECVLCKEALLFVASAKSFFKSQLEKVRGEKIAWGKTMDWLKANFRGMADNEDEERDALAAAVDKSDIVFVPSAPDGSQPPFIIKLSFLNASNGVIDVVLENAPAEMQNGIFTLCGIKTEIKEGAGSISLEEFKMSLAKGGSTYLATGSENEMKCAPVLFCQQPL